MMLDEKMALPLRIDAATYANEDAVLAALVEAADLSAADRAQISANAAQLVTDIRGRTNPGLMEVFLAEYGLSTDEGIALMCLAEALLRVPDADTIDALIEDKIAPSDWGKHMGHSTSSLVNASTWALLLTGKVLEEKKPGPVGHLRSAIRRLGEPVIRTAVGRAMKEMGRQFVLGENIEAAMKRAAKMEERGYTYSYDMLGEAARTYEDAERYFTAYSRAINAIANACTHQDIRKNPGISVKLSALHPRYTVAQRDAMMPLLVERLTKLCLQAADAGMGLNVDAEEANRLALSLEVIEATMADPRLAGWEGFGIVVQAYGKRAGAAIDWLYETAQRLDRKIMVRLVKGAYWDTEIKHAQVMGVSDFPVFTDKHATDISYIANAKKLLSMTDRIYPQFATHNAHTVQAVLHYAGSDRDSFEFQRLHGMGESLHDIVHTNEKTRCRIYAPVGAHRDLLAYLVRRLLENGANSSFVNQIVNEAVPPSVVASDPFDAVAGRPAHLLTGPELFGDRPNSMGWDIEHAQTLSTVEHDRDAWRAHQWHAAPLLAGAPAPETAIDVANPALPGDIPGTVSFASPADVETALSAATPWASDRATRAATLNRAADLFEAHYGELFALVTREAGKSLPDAIAELREAVDFLRYYAANAPEAAPVGTFTCISPWNFPLAIFTGQVSAALATGNAVLAKPAEQTPLIAFRAVQLMHEAGVPATALQLLPGAGDVGAALTSDARVGGVAFTGSTETALQIRSAMAQNMAPGAPLVAETGGLNAMIVDSTALPEQAVQAVIESAFQSAGQRCSALRCLYVQEDIAPNLQKMLIGAMNTLTVGNPWDISTDVGPVIDAEAQSGIQTYIDTARAEGRVLHQLDTPSGGTFAQPTLLRVGSIKEMEREIFGPVLHLATFKSGELDQVIADINGTGYGLTFGLQTRIDDRVQHVTEAVHAGNIYVNRNQIGAIVGSQPFGGEGLSGTGPKAGGPNYLTRFTVRPAPAQAAPWQEQMTDAELQKLVDQAGEGPAPTTITLPGPTGESNRLTAMARPPVLCLGPTEALATEQAAAIRSLGGVAVVATGAVAPDALRSLRGISGVVYWGDDVTARGYGVALSERNGPILPLITGQPDTGHARHERHVCVDTTAAGGNAALLAASS